MSGLFRSYCVHRPRFPHHQYWTSALHSTCLRPAAAMMATVSPLTRIAPVSVFLHACLMKAAAPTFDSVHQEHGDWQEMRAACAGERATPRRRLRCPVNTVETIDRRSIETDRSQGPFWWYCGGAQIMGTLSASPTRKWSRALYYLGTPPYPFDRFCV